ncbi:hypothetical protein [Sessilibacter sp. MAH4]
MTSSSTSYETSSVARNANFDRIKVILVNLLRSFGDLNFRDDDVYFKQDGLLDSLNSLRFFMMVQKEFNIRFSPQDVKENNLTSLLNLTEFVARKVDSDR